MTEEQTSTESKPSADSAFLTLERWRLLRISSFLIGVLGSGPIFVAAATYLPQWLIITYILMHTSLAVHARDGTMRDDYHFTPGVRAALAIAWLSFMYFWLSQNPFDLIVFTHHFFTSALSTSVNTWMWYFQIDEPTYGSGQMCVLALDGIVNHLVFLLLYRNHDTLAGPLKWVGLLVALPLIVLSLAIRFALKSGGRPQQLARFLLARIRMHIMQLYWWRDVLDVLWMVHVRTHDHSSYINLHDYPERKKQAGLELPLYRYLPLEPGQIRLLVIKPTGLKSGSVFQASLTHVSLAQLPTYEAISYRWGDPALTDEIIIDYQAYHVTRSVLDVLRCRRRWFEPRTIWIDAICINQNDPVEKTSQVQMMQEIYARAVRVVAFPGFQPELRLVQELLYEEAGLAVQYGLTDSPWNFRPLLANGNFTERWKAYKNLLMSDYFQRAWVVQEIAAGRQVLLYLHGFYVPWSIFLRATQRFGDPFKMAQLELAGHDDESVSVTGKTVAWVTNVLGFIDALRAEPTWEIRIEARLSGASNTLQHLYEQAFTVQASDPRDFVFAIIGLATDIDRLHPLLRPDYSKIVSQVFQNIARYLFVEAETPSIILLGRAGIGYEQTPRQVPSWVPDPSRPRICTAHNQCIISRTFDACGQRHSLLQSRMSSHGDLQVRGVFVDEIALISEIDLIGIDTPASHRLPVIEVTRRKAAYVVGNTEFLSRHRRLLTDFDIQRDLYRLFVIDHIEDARVDEHFRSVFSEWLQINLTLSQSTSFMDLVRQHDEMTGENIWAPLLPAAAGSEPIDRSANVYNGAFSSTCAGRRVAISSLGRPCLVPLLSRPGDRVFIPCGSVTPYLVRGGENRVQLVGEVYVHGIMYGEAMNGDVEPARVDFY